MGEEKSKLEKKLEEQENLNKKVTATEKNIQRIREKLNEIYVAKEKEVLEKLRDKVTINGVVNTAQLKDQVELELEQNEEYRNLLNKIKRLSINGAHLQRQMQINQQWILSFQTKGM